MPLLIHLNGPPGIGKSTIAALYADRHPGTLNLDIDTLHRLVGGWRDEENRTHDILRPVAFAMAAAHLTGGRDVIVPQFRARFAEIEAFEHLARENGAGFCEIVLLADKDESVARFDRRTEDSEWNQHNRDLVARRGGPAALADWHDRLVDVLAKRSSAAIVHSEPGQFEETYALVIAALRRSQDR